MRGMRWPFAFFFGFDCLFYFLTIAIFVFAEFEIALVRMRIIRFETRWL